MNMRRIVSAVFAVALLGILNVPSSRAQTPAGVQVFFDAIAAHDLTAVRRMLAKDKSLARSADVAGSTALMQSAYAGTLAIMEALLDAGADVKASNRRKATALHWAISDPMKAKLVLLHGADVDAKTVDGRTPLHAAATLPMGGRVVKLLLEVGADVDARTMTGNTPLFGAAAAGVENTLLLLDHGADPNIASHTGRTPLMGARTADVVWLLVAKGAHVNARSKRGETALAAAAGRGDDESVEFLLSKGADVNATDYRGYTPLMHAAQHDRDSPDVVRMLLAYGANADVTADGQTAASIAARRGDTALACLLREAAAQATGPRQRP